MALTILASLLCTICISDIMITFIAAVKHICVLHKMKNITMHMQNYDTIFLNIKTFANINAIKQDKC